MKFGDVVFLAKGMAKGMARQCIAQRMDAYSEGHGPWRWFDKEPLEYYNWRQVSTFDMFRIHTGDILFNEALCSKVGNKILLPYLPKVWPFTRSPRIRVAFWYFTRIPDMLITWWGHMAIDGNDDIRRVEYPDYASAFDDEEWEVYEYWPAKWYQKFYDWRES